MIRESLIEWKSTTELLIRILDVQDEELYDRVIEKVDSLLNKRELLKPTIQLPFTKEENEFGQNLLDLEKVLDKQLKLFSMDIQKNIQVQQKKKVSVHAYLNPYNKVYKDGTFYDKKR
ncbi:MAG TPA: hypothetical protein VNR38_00395 [Ureibacillus sp.]|nr:hypothetical protein [Ureibacillus sp.]